MGGVKQNRVLNNQAAPQCWKRQNNSETKAIIGYASFTVYKALHVLVHNKLNVKWWNVLQLWLSKTMLIATSHITINIDIDFERKNIMLQIHTTMYFDKNICLIWLRSTKRQINMERKCEHDYYCSSADINIFKDLLF